MVCFNMHSTYKLFVECKKYKKKLLSKLLLLYLFRVHILEQWAKIVVVLERGFSRNQLLEFQKMYAIKMMGPPKENLAEITEQVEEQRGLMVIKTSSKTKARQRKGAISNWKVRELQENYSYSKLYNFEWKVKVIFN